MAPYLHQFSADKFVIYLVQIEHHSFRKNNNLKPNYLAFFLVQIGCRFNVQYFKESIYRDFKNFYVL